MARRGEGGERLRDHKRYKVADYRKVTNRAYDHGSGC
jgi:hypothetical protein